MRPNVALAIAGLLLAAGCAPRTTTPSGCRECRVIERRLAARSPATRRVRGEHLQMALTSRRFYREREFAPAWSSDGRRLPRADTLIRELQAADWEGLNPLEYHVRAVDGMRRKWPAAPTPEFLADFDLLLTDGYLLYASHLLGGRTNVEMAKAQWRIIRKKADPADLLATALDTDEITESLRSLVPPHDGYARLKSALARYREIARDGGWSAIPDGPIVKPGDADPRIPLLRQRLAAESGRPAATPDSRVLDAALRRDLAAFQRSHGIDADGRLGADTVTALNVPVDDRINQIKFTMDRWRWLPLDLGRRHIIVNIPEFRLFAREEGAPTLGMPIIVGKSDDETATPEFSHMMTYIEFSPEWNVPRRIAVEEMLPVIQADPTYLSRNHLEVLTKGAAGTWTPVDPGSIAWSSMTAAGFPYRLRQRPGPWNALGTMKFMFPNEHSVYIHGNADVGLFDRRLRMFSHGCVRVDHPARLARWVLDDADWTPERIRQYTRQPEPVVVPLGDPVPVYLVYWTSWVSGDGTVHFREDIYGRDRQMRARFYPEQVPKPD